MNVAPPEELYLNRKREREESIVVLFMSLDVFMCIFVLWAILCDRVFIRAWYSMNQSVCLYLHCLLLVFTCVFMFILLMHNMHTYTLYTSYFFYNRDIRQNITPRRERMIQGKS